MGRAVCDRARACRGRRAGEERGEGRLGFVVTLAVVVVAGWIGYKLIPVRINAYQFRDTLREEARYASVHRYSDEEIRKRILEEARSLAIPLDPDDLSISRSQKEVVIRAKYQQPIDLKLTTYIYRFDDEQRSPVF
jgi:hypothetical protein